MSDLYVELSFGKWLLERNDIIVDGAVKQSVIRILYINNRYRKPRKRRSECVINDIKQSCTSN